MNRYFLFFLIVGLLHLIGMITEGETIVLLTKPLLVPSLVIYYLSKNPHPDRGILIALFFSFLGDVFLIKDTTLFFLFGLGCFLLTQILYTLKMGERILRIRKHLFLSGIPFALYGATLLYFLFPHLGKLTPAVMVYAFAISCFGILSLTYWIQNSQKGKFILGGAFLFILSDSMLALNQFYFESNFFGFWVMATYLGAQGMITFYFKNEALASNS